MRARHTGEHDEITAGSKGEGEWRIREEAEDRDRRLVELRDERERHMREWWMREVDRRDEIMLCQMFLIVKDAHSPDESSTSRPDQPTLPTDQFR